MIAGDKSAIKLYTCCDRAFQLKLFKTIRRKYKMSEIRNIISKFFHFRFIFFGDFLSLNFNGDSIFKLGNGQLSDFISRFYKYIKRWESFCCSCSFSCGRQQFIFSKTSFNKGVGRIRSSLRTLCLLLYRKKSTITVLLKSYFDIMKKKKHNSQSIRNIYMWNSST